MFKVQPQSPTPLTVVTTSLEAQPVLQIASETKALAASLHQPSPKTPKTLLTPSQFRERQILKLCLPHSQSTSLLNKNASNAPSNKLEFKIVPDMVKRTVTRTPLIKPNVPTLIRRLPSATNQKIQVSSATIVKMTPRQSALRFAIQQRMNPKRSIPLRRPRQETQTSNVFLCFLFHSHPFSPPILHRRSLPLSVILFIWQSRLNRIV